MAVQDKKYVERPAGKDDKFRINVINLAKQLYNREDMKATKKEISSGDLILSSELKEGQSIVAHDTIEDKDR